MPCSALVGCITGGGKVLACGNGGSAADAQHFAAEFVGRFERERPGLAAIALTTDTSILTAVGNDYGFDAHLLQAGARRSASPATCCWRCAPAATPPTCSPPIEAAHAKDMTVVALTGRNGGKIARRC